MNTVIKLQQPLATSGDGPSPWLAYGQSRDPKWFLQKRDIPNAVLAAMGDDPKGYFEASIIKGEIVSIGERVDDQPW